MQHWVRSFLTNPAEDHQCKVDDGLLWLQQRGGKLFALAELTNKVPLDEMFLAQALRLSAPALRHYGRDSAALALQNNSLVLILRLHEAHSEKIAKQLESLLNQRDVWQSLLQKLQKSNNPLFRAITQHGFFIKGRSWLTNLNRAGELYARS